MDRIDDMRLLVEAVELGSLARGGRQLGLSPASASRRLKRLEEHAGGRLLERTTRQLRLTDLGSEYYRRAKDILARVDELDRLVVERGDEPGGTLRVLSRRSFGLAQIAPLLAGFGREQPAVSVELTLTEAPDPLLAESIDLLIRLDAPQEKSLVTRRLASRRRVLCASADYLAGAPPLERPEDLQHHACLAYRFAYERSEWRFRRGDAALDVLVDGPLESNSGEVLRRAARGGLGITLLPAWLLDADLESGELVECLAAWTAWPAFYDGEIHAVHRRADVVPARITAFLAFLESAFAGRAWFDD